MYSIILADDHKHTIDGLKKHINWDALGIEVVGTAADGQEGMAKIVDINPDIALVDIHMPSVNGLDMIKELTGLVRSKFVILTGCNEFDYIKEAMEYRVEDYIVKPATPAEITEVLKRVVNKCEEEQRKILNEKRLVESIPLIREKFLEELFDGNITDPRELEDKLNFLELDFTDMVFRVGTVQIDSFEGTALTFGEKERQGIKLEVISLCAACLDTKLMMTGFKERNSHFLMVIPRPQADAYTDEALSVKFGGLLEQISEKCRISCSVGIGRLTASIDEIKLSYTEAVECLKYKIYLGNGKVIFYGDMLYSQMIDPILQYYDRNLFVDGIKMRSVDVVNRVIADLFSNIRRQESSNINYIRTIVNELFSIACSTLSQMGEMAQCKELEPNVIWRELEKRETLAEMNAFAHQTFHAILDSITKNTNQRNGRIIEQIILYVEENYQNEISLKDLAAILFFTPNYLSNIFTKSTGKSFNKFLYVYRMEKAKELLGSGMYKVYEVGAMVGYKSEDYFRKLFKEFTGINPSVYRK
ncbi:hypothetical protein FACS189492_2560 [Clostridia bacterium]|nr:hypothetical protein FACS189492_2560 [Clostridia bacterium]